MRLIMDSDNAQPERQASERSDDYLWNGSGKPDPEIERLERLLGKFHHDRRGLVFPETVPSRRWSLFPRRVQQFALAMGIATAVAIAAVIFVVYKNKPTPITVAGWDV